MNCPKCGRALHPDEQIFCTQCGTPVSHLFTESPPVIPERQNQRRRRWPLWTVLAVLLVIFVLGPVVVGFQAKPACYGAVAQLAASGLTAQVLTYHQGWFSSDATIAVGTHGMQTVVAERINHGPYPIWTGWFSATPVAAVVDSEPASASRTMLPADLLLRTIVYFNGRSRTRVSMPPRTINGATGGANFLGLDGEIDPLPGRLRVYLHSPGAVGPGLVGWSITEFTFNGDWRSAQGSIWTGGSETTIREINLTLPGKRGGSLQLLDANTASALNDGLLKFQGALRISSAVLGSESVGKTSLVWELGKIDPGAIAAWNQRALALQGKKLDKEALMAAARSGLADFVMALAAKGPQLKSDFTMAVSDGSVTANLNVSLMPPSAVSVAPAAPPAQPVLMRIVEQQVFSKATVQAPSSFVDRIMGPDKINRWVQAGTLVKDGSQYVLKADFAGGKLTVNGKQVLDLEQLPAAKTPSAAPKSA
ncbi:MAG TPA: DUF945 family protein [Candidatus Binataceae bacterium]|nr:DUF945 family protein [Candidatus Binataceae bacterium]